MPTLTYVLRKKRVEVIERQTATQTVFHTAKDSGCSKLDVIPAGGFSAACGDGVAIARERKRRDVDHANSSQAVYTDERKD